MRRGRERLAQDVDLASLVPMSNEKQEQLGTIEEKIKKLLEQSENLGEEGKVDEAQALMKKVLSDCVHVALFSMDLVFPFHVACLFSCICCSFQYVFVP